MNPCPCGYLGHPRRACRCSSLEMRAYRQRVSGPLLDRVDLFLEVGPVSPGDLLRPDLSPAGERRTEGTRALAARVLAARRMQGARWGEARANAEIPLSRLLRDGQVQTPALERLRQTAERLALSARGFARCLRVARTVADVQESPLVEAQHVEEALQFREPAC